MLRIIFIIKLITLSILAESAIITVSSSTGLWNSAATWDLNRIPATNDVVVIPAGMSVRVNNNMYHGVPSYPSLEIKIYGTLQFVGSGQLNLECGSSLCTFDAGSIPSTGSNSNQITIGPGLAPWKGSYPSITSGNCVYSSSCPLPVIVTSFEAVAAYRKFEVNWQSASEINFHHYELQRSFDGSTFETIYTVKGGSSNYSYQDYTESNSAYYQLKMIDQDGSIKKSNVIEVHELETLVSIFPNPAAESFTVNCESGSSFQLVDSFGKSLKSGSLTAPATQVMVEDFPSGIYWLIVDGPRKQTSFKLVIQ